MTFYPTLRPIIDINGEEFVPTDSEPAHVGESVRFIVRGQDRWVARSTYEAALVPAETKTSKT